jgi:hypothetical protein
MRPSWRQPSPSNPARGTDGSGRGTDGSAGQVGSPSARRRSSR